MELSEHMAQAVDGASLAPKGRCVQCKKSFGFKWALKEDHIGPEEVKEWAKVKANEGEKCAEPWLWQFCEAELQ